MSDYLRELISTRMDGDEVMDVLLRRLELEDIVEVLREQIDECADLFADHLDLEGDDEGC